MPLLRSLTAALGWRCYRHGAPKGAFLFGTYSTESSEEQLIVRQGGEPLQSSATSVQCLPLIKANEAVAPQPGGDFFCGKEAQLDARAVLRHCRADVGPMQDI